MAKLKDQIIMYREQNGGMSIDFDIVALVKCVQCRHYRKDPETGIWECVHRDGLMTARPDSWCSYGEEKGA